MFNRECKHRLRAIDSTMEMIDISDDDKYVYETYECSKCQKTKVYKAKF